MTDKIQQSQPYCKDNSAKKKRKKKPAWHSPEIGTMNLSIEYSEYYCKTVIKKMTYCF